MSTLIIINNAAAKARHAWPIIKQQLDDANFKYNAYETKTAGDATAVTRSALRNGVNSIAVIGGDGTLSEVAEGFFQFNDNLDVPPTPINPDAILAILPAGTGDDFARGLRGERASLESWVDTLLRRDTSAPLKVDVLYGRCDDYEKAFICLNASTMGIGGETAARVAGQNELMRRFPGEFRFLVAALGALAAWRERRVRVTVDGKTFVDGPMNLVGVANGLYAGGGMMFTPEARVDDGKLDVVTASGLSRANVVKELSHVHRAGHVNNPKVSITQGEIVRIETFLLQDALKIEADGNVRGVTPAQFQIMPAALKLLVSKQ
jgi:diacylglycerol kinase (ATP)